MIPPLLSFFFIGLLVSGSEAEIIDIFTLSGSLTILAIPVAAFGFFLNDWTDIRQDVKAGKKNIAVSLPAWARITIMTAILTPLFMLLWYYPYHLFIKILTITELLLLFLYSCPPFRLKRNIPLTILLDALYSGAIPFLIAITLSVGSFDFAIVLLTFIFGLTKGIRNILFHLQEDKVADWEAGRYTIAHKVNIRTLLRSQELFWLIESVLLLEICRMASSLVFGVMAGVFLLMLVKRRYYMNKSEDTESNRKLWLSELNAAYELWLPVAVISVLMLPRDLFVAGLALAMYFLLFPKSRNILHELKLLVQNIYFLFYNIYYFFSDLYFLQIKPVLGINKTFRSKHYPEYVTDNSITDISSSKPSPYGTDRLLHPTCGILPDSPADSEVLQHNKEEAQ